MLDIKFETDKNLYTDYNQALKYLKDIRRNCYKRNYKTNFHVYSEIKTEKELLCIQSYFATQDLKNTKLILWSDYDISKNQLLLPFKESIEYRVYSPHEEAKGTALEGCKKWLEAQDSKHYMKSGVLRFLVTHKYGGVWADMDMVLLNDFTPILDQEWAYVWGQEYDFENFGPCAAMMNIFKDSEHSNLCIKEILNTEVQSDSTCLDHQLLSKVYKKRPFYIFPSAFFNTEWQMNATFENGLRNYNPNGEGTKTESGWFTKNEYSNRLFLDAFSWHWHNSSYKNRAIEEGSKFNLLQKHIKNKLNVRGIC